MIRSFLTAGVLSLALIGLPSLAVASPNQDGRNLREASSEQAKHAVTYPYHDANRYGYDNRWYRHDDRYDDRRSRRHQRDWDRYQRRLAREHDRWERRRDRDMRRWERQQRRAHRRWQRQQSRYYYGHDGYSPYAYQDRRPRVSVNYRVGSYLPSRYHGRDYWLDHGHYGFQPAPYGHRWVRHNNDALLVAITTGLIVDAMFNRF